MADLDDFFAKKDRKKSKGKKFATADEIAKKLEETGKRTEKTKKEKLQSSAGQDGEDPNLGNQEEDEWKDFEEEKKDYTGLKIQNLTIESEAGDEGIDDGEDGEDGEMEENEAGELVPKRKVQAGPWKFVAQPQIQEEIPEIKPVEKKPAEEVSTKGTSGSYVPPHVRNLAQQPSHHNPRLLKSKAAPDVNNEDLFPTLSAAKNAEPATGAWGRKRRDDGIGFEEVRNSKSHSSRYSDTAAKMTPGKLALDNKYGALTQDQS
ncbi:protein CDV3 homolog [Lycorma delicatula]|uniref:protein CDV3 homolog n=1 Tax=Lycorma delicatula TaxID=130591 RepID=UPI003F50E490